MTRVTLVLTGHSLRRLRTLLLAMTGILAGFQVLVAALADWLASSSAFGQIAALVPPNVKALMGPSFLTMMSVSGIVALGYYHTAVEAALVALMIVAGTEPVGEQEAGFTDLVLSRSVPRTAVMGRTLLLVVLCPTIVVPAMGAGTAAGVRWMLRSDLPAPDPATIAAIMVNLWALLIAWGGIAMAVASVVRRRGQAVGLVAAAALVTVLIDYLARAWTTIRQVAWVSPFHFYSPLEIVTGAPLSTASVATLLAIGAVGATTAFVVFGRKDL